MAGLQMGRSADALIILVLATIAACASPNLDEPPPLVVDDPRSGREGRSSASPAPTGSGSVELPPPASAPLPDSSVDAGRGAQRWHGALSTTLPVSFGGGQYCPYRIALKQIDVDVTANEQGDIVAANVSALAVESLASGSCNTTSPIPPNTHTYVLAQATRLPSGVTRLELAGASTNQPAASLVIEGDFGTFHPFLSLRWHRTDQGPPLDWAVDAQISSTPR